MEHSMIDLFGISVQLLGMPESSAALFLLAGMLLGHLLWYRERGKKTDGDPDLESRYIKARSSLKQRKGQLRELQKKHDSTNEDLTILQQAHSTLRSKNKRLEQISKTSQDELNQFRHSLNDAEIQLASEEKRNQTVIDQLQNLIENKATLANENKAHQEGFEQLDQQYRQCVSELEEAHCELDKLRSQLGTNQSNLDDQQKSIKELEQGIATREQALSQANDSLQQTQQDLVARCKDLDAVRNERDQFAQQSQARQETLDQLETDLTLATQIQTERDEFANDLAAAASSLSEQRQTLEQCESELELKNIRLGELEQQINTTTDQLTEEHEHRLQLEQFNHACQNQLAELETQISNKSAECEQLNLALGTAQGEHAQSQERIPALLVDLEHANARQLALRTKLTDLQQLVEQQEQQIFELCAIREEAAVHALDLAETRTQLASETAKIADLQQQTEKWHATQRQLETAQTTIQQYHERNAAHESVLLQQADQLAALKEQANRIPDLELELKYKQTEIVQLCNDIDLHQGTILTAQQIFEETQSELAATIAEIHVKENRIESMSEDILSLTSDNALLSTAHQRSADQANQLQLQLDQSHANQQQLEQTTSELLTIQQERDLLINTRDGLEATISRLGTQITTHLTETKQIRDALSQQTLEHQKLETALRTEVEARDTTISELKTQLSSRSQQHDAVVDDLAMKTSKLDQQRLEIEQLVTELEETKTANDEMEKLKTDIDQLEKQLQSKSEGHEVLLNDLSAKKSQLVEQNNELERLATDLKAAESARKEHDLLKQESTELRSHLSCVREELEDSLDTNAKGQDRIRDLENQLHDHVKKIRDLRRERNSSSMIKNSDDATDTDSDRKAA